MENDIVWTSTTWHSDCKYEGKCDVCIAGWDY